MTPQDREDAERMDAEAPKPPLPPRDHPNKPFRTPNKTKTHPAPEVGTDGHRQKPDEASKNIPPEQSPPPARSAGEPRKT